MGASPSNFRVEETTLQQYSYSTLVEKKESTTDSFQLFRVTTLRYEGVLYRNDQHPKCLSLFRMEDETAARDKFKRLYKNLSPFYKTSRKCFNAGTMQELIDTMEQHPEWSLADVAKHLDLRECLSHERIAASTDNKASSALHVACKTGKTDFIQSLTSINARDFVKDKLGNTPLHYAAENYPEILISMIQKAQYLGGQVSEIVNSHNVDNQTALDVACHFSQEKGVKVLLEAGADVNHVEGYQKAIHTALKSNGARCAALILEFHPEQINEKDLKYGAFPLHWAKSKEAVHLLLKSGADIECKNNDGETPLHVMARRRRLGCVIVLLSYSADVNQCSNDGSTPLHVAAQADDCDIVRALIVFGADVNATNDNHYTARHIATKEHHLRWKDVVDALCHVGASRCAKEKNGCNLPCSKEFKGQLRIGDAVNKVSAGLFRLPGYEDLIRAAAVSAALSQGKDSVDGQKPQPTKSIFKQKNGRDSVLTMDGGGIRGLVLIQLLLAIQEFTGERIVDLFDWIGGTSTGGILALALVHGKSIRYCQGLYFMMKDEVFNGPRPYNSEPLERFLREQFGENTTMTSVTHPKALVTAVLADRRPASLYFFRNYDMPEDKPTTAAKSPFPSPPVPSAQQVWRAARGTGAAPTFFRAMGRFLDGGLIANNPTLDIITEIHKYYKVHDTDSTKGPGSSNIGLVVSLGTGVPPTEHVMNIDVFKPDSIWDATNIITGARALGTLLVDQACATHGAVVERASVWCEMIGVPFYRLSSDMSVEVGLDETDDKILVKMLWETKVYVLQHFKEFKELAERLTT